MNFNFDDEFEENDLTQELTELKSKTNDIFDEPITDINKKVKEIQRGYPPYIQKEDTDYDPFPDYKEFN